MMAESSAEGMRNPFAPRGYLETNNSLNRVILSEPPYAGRQAVDLLSADAVIGMIAQSGLEAVLPEDAPEREWPQLVSEFAGQPNNDPGQDDRSVRTAKGLAREYGRRFEAFLSTLLVPTPASRSARPDWNDEHWNWWAGMERIVLGGGLSRGAWGRAILEQTTNSQGFPDVDILFPEDRDRMPLAGAASLCRPEREGWLAAMDFGHSSVKRCAIRVTGSGSAEFSDLPSLATPRDFSMLEGTWHADNRKLREFFFGSIREGLEEVTGKIGRPVGLGLSIANYVQAGRVVPRGLYGFLAREASASIPGDADPTYILEEITDLCAGFGIPAPAVSLAHDGTAAAALFDRNPKRMAVILLGSAVGGGFPDAGR